MSLGTDAAPKIASAVALLGTDGTITRTTGATRDPVARKSIAGTTTTTAIKAVTEERRATNAQGSLVLQTVLYTPTEPLVDDQVAYMGKSYRVTAVETIALAGTALLYGATVER